MADLTTKSNFDYGQLDGTTSDFLRQKETNMREIVGKAYTDLGRELKEAQTELRKQGSLEGFFQKWYESVGFSKDRVSRLIRRYELFAKCEEHEQELLEDLPVSLTYEISKPSADEDLRQRVLDGEVKSLKEYRELEDKIKQQEEELSRLKEREPEVIEKVIEKPVYHTQEVVPDDVRRKLSESDRKIKEVEREKEETEASLVKSYARIRELEKLERSVKNEVENPLYDIYRSTAGTVGYYKVLTDQVRFAREVISNAERPLVDKIYAELQTINRLSEDLMSLIDDERGVVVVEGETKNYVEVVK